MKLSTRIRYGSRALVEMSRHYTQGPLNLKVIANRQGISLKYLEQIFMSLKAAGLVRSVRGNRGGYLLSRPPEKIKLYDVFQALEGPLYLVDCINNPQFCSDISSCPTHDIWSEIGELIKEVLSSLTLAQVLQRLRTKENQHKKRQRR